MFPACVGTPREMCLDNPKTRTRTRMYEQRRTSASSKWEGQGVEEQRGEREIAWERKVCCTNAEQGYHATSNMWARDTAVIGTTCILQHCNKVAHCSLQLFCALFFETM